MAIMYHSWFDPIRMNIPNFLIYCNRIVFHKLVVASNCIHNALLRPINEIRPQFVVKVITNDNVNLKKVGGIVLLSLPIHLLKVYLAKNNRIENYVYILG